VICLMTVPSDMAIGHEVPPDPHVVRLPARIASPVPMLGTNSGDPGRAVHSLAACLALGAGTHEAEAV
jgi:hypothetical protein